MMLNTCWACGEDKKMLDENHMPPRFLGWTAHDIVKNCRRCHIKADAFFLKLLLNPFNENSYGKRHTKEYMHKWYIKHKEGLTKSGVCEMCGVYERGLHEHHALPRWLGGVDEDIIGVCRKCHTKAEEKFIKLLLNPFGENSYGNRNKSLLMKEYYQKNKKRLLDCVYGYYRKHKKHLIKCAHKRHQRYRIQILERKRKYYREHREQKGEYNRKYYQKHHAQEKARAHKYYQKHRKQRMEHSLRYYQEHKERRKERMRKYYQEHKEQQREYKRKYRQQHKEQIRKYHQKYYREYKERIRAYQRKYRQEHKK